MKIRLATRGSALALWQANHVRDRLLAQGPDTEVELVVVRTTGDNVTDVPLARIGGRGLFTREVDDAVLSGRADAAVHSLKDLPTTLEEGLELAAVLPRANAFDAFVPAPGLPRTIDELPAGSRIGTSALRRRAQLLARRPDLEVVDLRGNLDTRLDRLEERGLAGAILAVAGLERLGRADRIGEVLEPPQWLPAVGQGALALVGAARPPHAIRALDHHATRAVTAAERSLLRRLEGGCQVPIGAHALLKNDELRLEGLVASLDGRTLLRAEDSGASGEAEALGRRVAERLIDQGADALLESIRRQAAAPAPPAP